MIQGILVLALLLYGVSTAVFVAHLLSRKAQLAKWGLWILMVGLAVQSVGKIAALVSRGALPVTHSIEALGILGLGVAAVFVWVAHRYGVPVLGAFAVPISLVSLAASLAFGGDSGAFPDALKDYWAPVHFSLAIAADALLVVAGTASVAYLFQDRLLRAKSFGPTFRKMPPLHVLDEIAHRLLTVGFLLMTLGMVAGTYLAKKTWGSYWSNDPRQTWSLITWFIFAAVLHARIVSGWQGKRAAWLTLLGVALVLSGLVGLSRLTKTRHGGEYTLNLPAPTHAIGQAPGPAGVRSG
jgi:cytochrome c-type biogenesis protein CcsB